VTTLFHNLREISSILGGDPRVSGRGKGRPPQELRRKVTRQMRLCKKNELVVSWGQGKKTIVFTH